MEKNSLKTLIPISVLLIFVVAGCASANKTKGQLSDHYKEYKDYESLVALVPYLNYPLTRSNVEDLLGEPAYCPSATDCYYTTDKSVVVLCRDSGEAPCKDSPLTLIIGYVLAEKNKVSPQDNLGGFVLAPIDN